MSRAFASDDRVAGHVPPLPPCARRRLTIRRQSPLGRRYASLEDAPDPCTERLVTEQQGEEERQDDDVHRERKVHSAAPLELDQPNCHIADGDGDQRDHSPRERCRDTAATSARQPALTALLTGEVAVGVEQRGRSHVVHRR